MRGHRPRDDQKEEREMNVSQSLISPDATHEQVQTLEWLGASVPKVSRPVPFLRFHRFALFVLTAAALIGCNGHEPVDPPTELEPHSSFEIGHRPSMNSAHAVASVLQGSDLRLESVQTTGYADLEFFPITRPDMFELWPATQSRRHEQLPDLGGVDFGTQFAFLVAHPDGNSYNALLSGQAARFFADVAVSYTDELIVLHLKASRLGGLDPIDAMSSGWKGDIYAVPRRDREQLEVRLDDEVFRYSLVDEAVAGAATEADTDGDSAAAHAAD